MGKTLADAIRERLDQTGETQTDLANQLGVTQPTVFRWLTAYSTPSDNLVPGLARWLKLSPTKTRELVDGSRTAARTRATSSLRSDRAMAALVSETPKMLQQILDELTALREGQARIEDLLAKKGR